MHRLLRVTIAPEMEPESSQAAPLAELPPDVPYRAIVEQAIAGVYVMQDERFAYCNARWAEMLGRTQQEVIGAHLDSYAPPAFLPQILQRYHQRLRGEPPSIRFVTRAIHKQGHELRIDVHGSRIIFRGRPAVMGIGVDITQRLQDEEELRRSREQLRELGAYTTRKLEEQRLTFARDIHDELAGILTSIKMDATRILRRADRDELRELTRGLIELTDRSIETVQRISEDLRPTELDHLGLDAVIARELADFSARYGVATTHSLAVTTVRLPPKRANAVYRIFHEALTNVARHAAARAVDVSLAESEARLTLEIADDGVGFPVEHPAGSALGLLSMHERAREIGAKLEIDSRPGRGTRLTVNVPLI